MTNASGPDRARGDRPVRAAVARSTIGSCVVGVHRLPEKLGGLIVLGLELLLGGLGLRELLGQRRELRLE